MAHPSAPEAVVELAMAAATVVQAGLPTTAPPLALIPLVVARAVILALVVTGTTPQTVQPVLVVLVAVDQP